MDLPEDISPEMELSPDFVTRLNRATRCLAHIRPLAEEIKGVPSERVEALLAHLTAAVVSAALKAVANFVSGDTGVWRHTRPLTGLRDYYRVRIGMRYRLLLRWEPDVCLEVVGLIPRQDLEGWVRRHRK